MKASPSLRPSWAPTSHQTQRRRDASRDPLSLLLLRPQTLLRPLRLTLFRRLQPRSKLPHVLKWLVPEKEQPLTPREKARTLVQTLDEATHACLREQAHLFEYGTPERNLALDQLAQSLVDNLDWHPQGLSHEEVEMIGYGWVADVVWAVAHGQSVSAYEIKIHELFRLKAEGQALPPLRPQRNGRESSRLSPRPRRHLR